MGKLVIHEIFIGEMKGQIVFVIVNELEAQRLYRQAGEPLSLSRQADGPESHYRRAAGPMSL